MQKKMFVESLSTKGHVIDWKTSVGKEVNFIFDDVNGVVKIVDYDGKNLYIKYQNKPVFKIRVDNFKECKVGNLINKVNREFKYKIGQRFVDSYRDLTIIGTEIRRDNKSQNWRVYKYHCNICDYEGKKLERFFDVEKGSGCFCCSKSKNKTLVPQFRSKYE